MPERTLPEQFIVSGSGRLCTGDPVPSIQFTACYYDSDGNPLGWKAKLVDSTEDARGRICSRHQNQSTSS